MWSLTLLPYFKILGIPLPERAKVKSQYKFKQSK